MDVKIILKSSTTKLDEHIPPSFLISTIVSFKYLENDNDV